MANVGHSYTGSVPVYPQVLRRGAAAVVVSLFMAIMASGQPDRPKQKETPTEVGASPLVLAV
jgi:hypothetical protein